MKIFFIKLIIAVLVNIGFSGIVKSQVVWNVSTTEQINEALLNASDGDTIKIANGIYKPSGVGRDATFNVTKAIVLSGGWYNNFTECDPANYKTRLWGDLNDNDVYDSDGFVTSGNDENAYNVVTWNVSSNEKGYIKGLTISNGKGGSIGAGLYLLSDFFNNYVKVLKIVCYANIFIFKRSK